MINLQTAANATADELSRGKDFWNACARRLDASARKINSNVEPARFQRFMDAMARARNVANACPTYSPCSRECVGV